MDCFKMTSKRVFDENRAGGRDTGAGNIVYGEKYCNKHNEHFSPQTGGVATRKKSPITVNTSDTRACLTCACSMIEPRNETCPNGKQSASGREKLYTQKQTTYASEAHERDMDLKEVLKCHTFHHLILNGPREEDHMQVESMISLNSMLPVHVSAEVFCASSHIPVPHNRTHSGHADKEVMAATVLTTLSTSPLVIKTSSGALVGASETSSTVWKESFSASFGSSTSGNWSWDASDHSVPSTPSPPLSNDVNKSLLNYSQVEDSTDEAENPHFLFEEAIPRKRKNSMKVMFKCLWKNCEKVLSTSLGIQKHIRTIHLGRNGDSDYSDGEEDFYYSEIEVNVDTLTEGLSNLTPASPTTTGAPPVFPLAPDIVQSKVASVIHSPLSQSAPSKLCHIHSDHAYQDAITYVDILFTGEKREPVAHAVTKTYTPNISTPKPSTATRKPRGEAKKCRKVYGMEKKDLWCTACRWKKACQRFTD